jgi:hypothetical protein
MRSSRRAMGGQAAYCDKTDAVLRDWKALLADLGAEAAGGTTRVRARYVRCADSFTGRYAEAQRKLEALRDAPGVTWASERPQLEQKIDELRALIDRARIL